jgi:hypothetical protein
MNRSGWIVFACAALLLTLGSGSGPYPRGDLAIDWWTVDGGGEMWCTGGDYELSGTIGQADASTVVMAGGDYELTGGFWPGAMQTAFPKVPSLFDQLDELVPDDVRPVLPP